MLVMDIYFVKVHNTLLHKPVSLNEAHIFLNIYYVRLLWYSEVQNILYEFIFHAT